MVASRTGHRRIADQPLRRGRQTDEPQDQRQHDYSRDRHDDENDPRQREQDGGGIEAHEAALLLLVVDHVERVEEGRHAGVRAPHGDQEAHDESGSQRLVALTRNEGDLVSDQLQHAAGQDARQQGQVPADGAGVGEESVKRDDGRNRGEGREQREERHAAGGREDAI